MYYIRVPQGKPGPDELYHHGIQGMRWGRKNGPPYPLDYKSHSADEKRQNTKKELSAYTDSKGEQSLKRYKKTGKTADIPKKESKAEKNRNEQQPKTLRELKEYEDQNWGKSSGKSGLTAEQKKKYTTIVVGTAAAIGVGAAIYFGCKHGAVSRIAQTLEKQPKTVLQLPAKQILQDPVVKKASQQAIMETLADGDRVLKQGSTVHRMHAYVDFDLSKVKKPLYVSYKDEDVATYMTLLKDWSGTGKRYDVTLTALKDMRIPSRQKAQEIFEELWNNDPKYRKQLQKTITDAYIKLGEKPDVARKIAEDSLKQDPFKQAMYSIVKNQDDTAKYLNKLRSAGYDAITNYFDKGQMANDPLIILDPGATLQKSGEKLVTKALKVSTLQGLLDKGISELPVKGMFGTKIGVKSVLDLVKSGQI